MSIIISSIVRHLLTLVAGGLLSVGVAKSDAENFASCAEPIASGVALYVLGQGWSLVDKKKKS
jgi:hypothetical protein